MIRIIAMSIGVTVVALSQTSAVRHTNQTTSGSCSPAAIAGGNVTITCSGLDKEQIEILRRIPVLIEQLVKQELRSRDAMLRQLEELARNQGPNPTDPFVFALICSTPQGVKLDSYSLPFSDVQTLKSQEAVMGVIRRFPNQRCEQSKSVIFRFSDEQKVLPGGTTATNGGNLGLVVIPVETIEELGGDHLAFTKIYSMLRLHAQ